MAPAGARRQLPTGGRALARAGWSVLSSSSLPGLPHQAAAPKAAAPKAASPLEEEDGARLVGEVAGSWGSRFMHTIRRVGLHDGAYHYECLFSRPLGGAPVPGMVVSVRFALLQDASGPRLLYSFEEGDLRHQWALRLDSQGVWRAAKGQQVLSLKHGVFESYLDSYVREKEATRERGINLVTPFEETRLQPPPSVHPEDESGSAGGGDGGGAAAPEAGCEQAEGAPEADSPERQEAPARVLVNGEPRAEPGAGAAEGAESVVSSMWNALIKSGLTWDKVAQPSSLTELLANMFDAADEDSSGHLSHYEVARVLNATLPGFGLEQWDIYALMSCAQESEDGFIDCQPFIEAAPRVMVGLRERRLAYQARGMPGVDVRIDAVRHCFGEEILGTAEALRKQFEECCNEDPSRGVYDAADAQQGSRDHPGAPHRKCSTDDVGGSRRASFSKAETRRSSFGDAPAHQVSEGNLGQEALVGMKRRHCRECLRQLPERLSPQEAQRIMEMLPEDEDGNLLFTDLAERLEQLRTEAISNGVVETDVKALRRHLVERFRRGLSESSPGKMKVWDVKSALLSADQVCLSRVQFHVLLCLAEPDPGSGDVDVSEFLRVCSAVIPHMCDARAFMATAERLILESEESRRRNENAELAALGAARVATIGQDGEEKSQENEVDQETVERSLVQALQFHDNTHRHVPALPPGDIFDVLFSGDAQVEGCQLSDFELNGLAAEMAPNADGEVPYVEHIKRWVPIIFEVRKSPLFEAYLKEDAAGTMGIPQPNPQELEAICPLLPEGFGSRLENKQVEVVEDSDGSEAPNRSGRGLSKARTEALGADSLDTGGTSTTPAKLTSFRRVHGQSGRVSSKTLSKLAEKGSKVSNASMEPPPGRGYERRKKLLLAASGEAAQPEP